jgi:outer membrane protein assembly factor BamB
VIASAAALARADDWPQWRGPERTGIPREKNWLPGWPEAKGARARVAWRVDVGKGHSTAAVVGERVYTMGWDGVRDTLFCLDAGSGNVVWKQSYPCKTIVQWPGPRATPTVADGVVYTLGQHGQLHAFAAGNGKKLWNVQLREQYMPDADYGFAWSPLVQGDLLILAAGTKGLALRRKDGSAAWGDDGGRGACASPVPFEHNGRRGVAVITTSDKRDAVNLVGVDPATGTELWRGGPWKEQWGAACVDLLVDGEKGKVFITTAEQFKQSARFSIAGDALKEDWYSKTFHSYTGGCVLLAGHLYGVSQRGHLTCLDWETGKSKWSQPGFGEFSSLIAADGKLIIQSRHGDLVIAGATPEAYRELRRMPAFEKEDPTTFTAPVLANGRIYCRSYIGELVCLDLRPQDG